jgi:osmotically-inducible protein OsmY
MKTDKQLQQDVIAELSWEPSVNAAHIGVEVSNGVVTLAGHVTNYAEKFNAERAAQRVAGVKALAIEMDVKLAGTSKRNDTELASSAEAALQSATYFSPNEVKIKVESGWITLSGDVEWDYQRQNSVAAVRHLLGVTGVTDQIAIKPKLSSVLVKSEIEAALKRRARTDAQKISVDIHGSDVTLTGSVHSWSERDLARESAWSTPGVRNVVDKMTVSY